jgi:hypothetical protein
MNTSKNKVLSVTRQTYTAETDYRFTIVEFIRYESETKTTYKAWNYCVFVYSRGELVGMSGYRPRDIFSVFKKSLSIKVEEHRLSKVRTEAIQKAMRHVLTQGQVFNATINYWDKNSNEGLATVHGVGQIPIYGCNAYNALTCYSETSCIQMDKGQAFSCQLADMGTHLTVTKYTGNFDQAASDKLDHSKLAFRKQNGKIVSGLFS